MKRGRDPGSNPGGAILIFNILLIYFDSSENKIHYQGYKNHYC